MKYLSFFSFACCAVIILGNSCRKSSTYAPQNSHGNKRQVQFVLYTNKDFSAENSNITFTLKIRSSANPLIWDSVLPPMKVKDIPKFADRLVVDKLIPGNDVSQLEVGFIYSIEHVGISWYWDKINPYESFKRVEFSFQ